MANNDNLRPFNTLPPDELREITRKGGKASGEKRREIADVKSHIMLQIAAQDLVEETREEYRRAIKELVKKERRTMRRRRGARKNKKAKRPEREKINE